MSIELLTVDNDVVTIKDNKVVGKGSRFDGREVKTDADIKEIFGIDVSEKDMTNYMKKPDQFFGDPGEQKLYQDAVKAERGMIKGPRAMQTMDAVAGQFPAGITNQIRKDAVNNPMNPRAMNPKGMQQLLKANLMGLLNR